jgi:FMN phosphatase YigB (HAD superfamily)
MMSMNAGLIFDLDETLYPGRQFVRSAFRAVAARKVSALGLAPKVDTVVYAQEWGSGRGKPERDSFDVVRTRLGTLPGMTVFVGDDPWSDMVGAREAGQHTILIRPEGGSPQACGADRVVSSLDGVLMAAAALICLEVADAA